MGAGGAGGISRIAEAEIRRSEGIATIFKDGDGFIAAAGGIVQRRHADQKAARCGGEAIREGIGDTAAASEVGVGAEQQIASADGGNTVEDGADAGDAQEVAIGIAVVSKEAGEANRKAGVFWDRGRIRHGQRCGVDRIELIEELEQAHTAEQVGAVVAVQAGL